jgi:hypothetical protein
VATCAKVTSRDYGTLLESARQAGSLRSIQILADV